MKSSDSHQQSHTSQSHSEQPFFGAKSEQSFFSKEGSQQKTFFNPSSFPIQAKLTVGAADDQYEQEADQVASEVVDRINNPTSQPGSAAQSVQRVGQEEDEVQMQRSPESIQRVEKEEEKLQMKPISETIQRLGKEDEELQREVAIAPQATAKGGDVSPDLETSIQQARGGRQAISEDVRVPLEQAFGADFSRVRIHTDAKSDQLNQSIQAKAFTTGQDVFFRQGAYEPGSCGGQELIAHELTHVVQQNRGAVRRLPLLPQPQYLVTETSRVSNVTVEIDPEPFGHNTSGLSASPEVIQRFQAQIVATEDKNGNGILITSRPRPR